MKNIAHRSLICITVITERFYNIYIILAKYFLFILNFYHLQIKTSCNYFARRLNKKIKSKLVLSDLYFNNS